MNGLGRQAVSVNRMVPGLIEHFPGHDLSGGKHFASPGVGLVEKTEKLVDGKHPAKAVAKAFTDQGGIVGEIGGALFGFPAAILILGPLRQIPVEKRQPGLNISGKEFIDEAFVKVETFFIDGAAPIRNDARPGRRESIRLDAQSANESDVAFIEMIVIDSAVSGLVHDNRPGPAREGVPHARGAAVFGDVRLRLGKPRSPRPR